MAVSVKLLWTENAAEQLQMLHSYVAQDSVRAANALIARVVDAAEALARFPQMGRVGRIEGTRELVVTGTPIILPYWVSSEFVHILAILHTSRKWPDSL